MRRVLRRAAPLLLAAAALGLARPAAAQPSPYAPASPTTAAHEEPDDQGPPLPRVVPPHRPMLSPLKEAPAAAAAPGPVVPAHAAVDQTLPSGATAVKPAVDLLAPPALPPAWAAKPAAPAIAVIPSGLPSLPTPAAAPARPPAVSGLASRPTPAAAPVRAPAASAPAVLPPSVSLSARTTLRPIAAVPSAHVWPAAFLTREAPPPVETSGVVSFENRSEPEKPTEPEKSAAAPPVAGGLRQRVEAACGPEATEIVVEAQPDGSVLVRVHVRDAGAKQKVADKILQLPEMTEPTVRLLLDVQP